MLFGGDGVVRRPLYNFDGLHIDLIAAWHTRRAGVGLDCASHPQAALLRDFVGYRKLLVADVALEHHALANAGAIPQLNKGQFALAGFVVDPALQGDGFADVLGKGFD